MRSPQFFSKILFANDQEKPKTWDRVAELVPGKKKRLHVPKSDSYN
ncbi:hypothetical protein [Daejeonella sp.]